MVGGSSRTYRFACRCKMQVFSDFSRDTYTGTFSVGWFWGRGWGGGGGGNKRRGVSVPAVLGSALKLFLVVQTLHGGLWCVVECMGVLYHSGTRNYRKLQLQGGGNTRYVVSNTVIPRLTKIIRSGITFVSRNVISRRFL